MTGQGKVNYSGGCLIRSYGSWEAIQFKRREHELRIGDERILGKSNFVELVLKDDTLSIKYQSVDESAGWDLPSLIKVICQHCGVKTHMISVRGRMTQVSQARQLLAYFAIAELHVNSV
jgi:chromosomal replication initiation ATPase DnaA